ncbi:rab guanine nucleotide exchange factor S2 [Saxophila tyrrhenica]|uniref:Rab guanine nucleotide exchange factor S2 n=1 Tax=Saxophila tyrrhenica TaxID=1690608 RepID=A0AAV9NXA8_9PEZI|nr:rab guanine nucleotide exchange factor S2 [Saxophila tyrrhenica]
MTTGGNDRTATVADYLFVSSWANGTSSLTSSVRPAQLTRSTTPSSSPTQASKLRNALPLPYRLVKSKSFAQLRGGDVDAEKEGMAAATVASPVSAIRDDHVMDTRTPSPVQHSPGGRDSEDTAPKQSTDGAYQPDLSQEVAMLSTKLVNAINYQTNLDDTLQATRHDLDRSQQELAKVRAEKQSLDDAIAQGVLVRKSAVDKTIAELRAELAKEKASRESAERAKRETDSELENLTANLFEEANKMVAAARRDTDAAEKRNSQLKNQIKDTEVLLASQQEQLQDLKLNMERQSERSDLAAARDSSMPSTPINSATAVFDAMYASSGVASQTADALPNQPLHFGQLVQPVLRNDVSAYNDFAELLGWARWTRNNNLPHSRNASGNQSTSASHTNLSMTSASAASVSSPNLPGAFSFGTSNSANSSPSSSSAATFTPPLKDSKFYKRSLLEDIEPTLRLDLAPGLSFLSRRTVNSALLNGTLTIEPFTPPTKFYSPIFACSLCGESRKAEPYIRRHRFRTSESDDASRYPLCAYCLERVRSSADFVGFLRMVRDGHWRCASEEESEKVWEEGVRLRERMFWARVGGGVVPAGAHGLRREVEAETSKKVVEGNSAATDIDRASDGEVVDEGVTGGTESVDDTALSGVPVVEDDAAEGGIGRAIINMASRAASSAVPELEPRPSGHRSSSASSVGGVQRESDATQTVATPPAHEATQAPGGQQNQEEAEAQLQREASAATENEVMATPPEMPQQEPFVTSSEASGPASLPAAATTSSPPEARPEDPNTEAAAPSTAPHAPDPDEAAAAAASHASERPRTPSPQKRGRGSETLQARPAQEERRPSSSTSSVLARVRAMEGKGK